MSAPEGQAMSSTSGLGPRGTHVCARGTSKRTNTHNYGSRWRGFRLRALSRLLTDSAKNKGCPTRKIHSNPTPYGLSLSQEGTHASLQQDPFTHGWGFCCRTAGTRPLCCGMWRAHSLTTSCDEENHTTEKHQHPGATERDEHTDSHSSQSTHGEASTPGRHRTGRADCLRLEPNHPQQALSQ